MLESVHIGAVKELYVTNVITRGVTPSREIGINTADSDTVSTYQVSSVQLVTDKKLEAFNKA